MFKEVIISPPLLNEQAIIANIEKTIAELSVKVKPQDVFVLYLGGHGKTVGARYNFVLYDLIYDGNGFLKKRHFNHTIKSVKNSLRFRKYNLFPWKVKLQTHPLQNL